MSYNGILTQNTKNKTVWYNSQEHVMIKWKNLFKTWFTLYTTIKAMEIYPLAQSKWYLGVT